MRLALLVLTSLVLRQGRSQLTRFLNDKNHSLSMFGMLGVKPFAPGMYIATGAEGLKFVVRTEDDIIAPMLSFVGQWERPFQQLVFQVMDSLNEYYKLRSPLYLDVGGNIGVWAIILASRVPEGKVITFEPQQDMINILGTNVLLNNVLNLATVRAFVGNSTGWSSISRVAVREDGTANYGAQSKEMLEQQYHGSSTDAINYRVPNLRLDDEFTSKDGLLAGTCPSFIKMDIEGGELLALIGGRETLRTCQPVLFLEAECKWYYRSLFFYLHSLGYSIAWVIAPIVDISLPPHFERFVTDTYHNLMQLYSSRNIIAVPRGFESILKSNPILAFVDVMAEFESNPSTWFSLDDRNVKICHDASGECFRWAQPLEFPTHKSDPQNNLFFCGDSTIKQDLVFLYKTF